MPCRASPRAKIIGARGGVGGRHTELHRESCFLAVTARTQSCRRRSGERFPRVTWSKIFDSFLTRAESTFPFSCVSNHTWPYRVLLPGAPGQLWHIKNFRKTRQGIVGLPTAFFSRKGPEAAVQCTSRLLGGIPGHGSSPPAGNAPGRMARRQGLSTAVESLTCSSVASST